ncbi:MAG: protein kinase [Deltaproteobacteria bacterium]|nr:protein kinase [Deltaproteobacteria bacterium]
MGTPPSPSNPPLPLAATLSLDEARSALEAGDATTALAHIDRALSLTQVGSRLSARRVLADRATERLGSGAAQEPDPWPVGAAVEDRWEVFGQVRGGMGSVYFVRDRELGGMELAVKGLQVRDHATPAERSRLEGLFHRETQVWLDLGAHPNLVSGYYTLPVRGVLRFFMEYVPGSTLEARVRASPEGLAVETALDLALQVAHGVEFLHARGVVHRDLKPGNCLVADGDSVRLTDFGLGKLAAEADRELLAGAGTPWYMAPEQWRSLGDAGEPADVYALGVLLHELLTGAPVFDGSPRVLSRYTATIPPAVKKVLAAREPSRELLLWLLHATVTPLGVRCWRPSLDPDLEALVLACLAKVPEARPRARAVRQALEACWSRHLRRPFPRPLRGALEPTEGGENNRAVSYAVMARLERSREVLDAWLLAHPRALRPWFNRRVLALATGEESPQTVALAFARELVPAHAQAVRDDPSLQRAQGLLRVYAPWPRPDAGALAASPDGEHLALAVGDVVHLLRAADGTVARTFTGHQATVCALAFSADGRRLLTGSHDRTARVWETSTARCVARLGGHRGGVVSVALGADGQTALTGSHDRTARLWDAPRGRKLAVLRGHRAAVTAVALGPDTLATYDGTLRRWLPDGTSLDPPLGELPGLRYLAWTAGGWLWACARGVGHSVEGWVTQEPLEAAVGLPDGAVAVLHGDGRVARFSLRGASGWADRALGRAVEALAVLETPAGPWVFGRDAEAVLAWPAGAGTPSLTLLFEPPSSVTSRLSREHARGVLCERLTAGDVSAYGALDALRVQVPDWRREEALVASLQRAGGALGAPAGVRDAWVQRTAGAPRPVQALRPWSERQSTLALGHAGAVGLWEWYPGGEVTPWELPLPERSALVAWHPDGRHLLASTTGGSLVYCRVGAHRLLRVWTQPVPRVTALALSGDGSRAVTGHEDGAARVWSLAEGSLVRVLRAHEGDVGAVALSHDGGLLAFGGWDGVVQLRDLARPDEERSLVHDAGGLSGLAFTQDDRGLAGAGEAGLRVWSLVTLTERVRASGSLVTALAVSPDGSLVACGGYDDAVRLWALRDGAAVCALEGHRYGVAALAWAPSGAHLVTAGADQSLRVWSVDRSHRFAEEVLPEALAALAALSGPDALAELWAEARRCTRGRALPEALGRDLERLREAIAALVEAPPWGVVDGLVPLGRAAPTGAR